MTISEDHNRIRQSKGMRIVVEQARIRKECGILRIVDDQIHVRQRDADSADQVRIRKERGILRIRLA